MGIFRRRVVEEEVPQGVEITPGEFELKTEETSEDNENTPQSPFESFMSQNQELIDNTYQSWREVYSRWDKAFSKEAVEEFKNILHIITRIEPGAGQLPTQRELRRIAEKASFSDYPLICTEALYSAKLKARGLVEYDRLKAQGMEKDNEEASLFEAADIYKDFYVGYDEPFDASQATYIATFDDLFTLVGQLNYELTELFRITEKNESKLFEAFIETASESRESLISMIEGIQSLNTKNPTKLVLSRVIASRFARSETELFEVPSTPTPFIIEMMQYADDKEGFIADISQSYRKIFEKTGVDMSEYSDAEMLSYFYDELPEFIRSRIGDFQADFYKDLKASFNSFLRQFRHDLHINPTVEDLREVSTTIYHRANGDRRSVKKNTSASKRAQKSKRVKTVNESAADKEVLQTILGVASLGYSNKSFAKYQAELMSDDQLSEMIEKFVAKNHGGDLELVEFVSEAIESLRLNPKMPFATKSVNAPKRTINSGSGLERGIGLRSYQPGNNHDLKLNTKQGNSIRILYAVLDDKIAIHSIHSDHDDYERAIDQIW